MTGTEIESSVLNGKRKGRLEWYERQIEIAGASLANLFREMKVDPLKPWLLTHESFEAYCRERWNMTERRTQQIAAAESVREMLLEEAPDLASQISDLKERPLRELASTPAEKRVAVLRIANNVPGVTTAAKLKVAKAVVIDGIEPPKKEVCPTCGRAK